MSNFPKVIFTVSEMSGDTPAELGKIVMEV